MIPANPSALPPITVSLTTIASRLGKVSRTLRSLLAQDYPRIVVRLYLSREPFLLDEGVPGALPAEISALAESDPRLEVRFTPNIGSYRKILPLLAEMNGTRALVVTADDDTVYPSDWLTGLYQAYQHYRCVVCYRGHQMKRSGRAFTKYRRWMVAGIARNPDLYNLPTGKDGVLYETTFFHPKVLNHVRALQIAPTADDLWLKWHYSAFEDVKTFVINTDYQAQTFKDDPFGKSLYEAFNRDGGNDTTIQRLEEYTADQNRVPLAARL